MMGPGSPGYVVIPCSIVWLRSMRRTRLLKPPFHIHPRHRADPRNGFPDFVVRGRGAGSYPDNSGLAEPALCRHLALGTVWLMPNGTGGDIDRVGILDVESRYS